MKGRVAQLGELRENCMHTAPRVSRGDLIKTVNDDAVSIDNLSLETRIAQKRSRAKSLHVRQLAKRLGQDALPETRVSKDHDRLRKPGDLILTDSPPLQLVVLVSESPSDRVRYHAEHSAGA